MTGFLGRLAVFAFAACLTLLAGSAILLAQDTAEPLAGAVPGNTTAASAADAELWREVRQGQSFSTTTRAPASGILIQSEGHDWEQTRNGPLAMYTAWAITGMLILLSLFFAIRGRIRIDAGRSGQTITRFTLIERSAHWLLATSFIILALTGLNLLFGRKLLIPLMGHEAFAAMAQVGKLVHNYMGFAFALAIVVIFVMWVLHNIPGPRDLVWLIRGGGLFGGGHPPAHKFNAGQKIIFWSVVFCGVSLFLSGWALLNPFTTSMMNDTFHHANAWFGLGLPENLSPIQEQQYQQIWHTVMAALLIAIVLAHIYIGTIGMEGAVQAMTSGEVDLNWAREHHSLWVEEHMADIHDRPRDPTAHPAE